MKRLALPLNILFASLILLIAAKTLADIASYQLTSFSGSPQTKPAQQANLKQQHSNELQSYAIILERGLFGSSTKGTLTPLIQQTLPNATTTPNDLILLGTAVGSPRESFILIRRISSNEERVFRIGEKVFDTGTLTSVRKGLAELRSGSRVITLRPPTVSAETSSTASTGQAVQGTGVVQASGSSVGIIDQRALHTALDNIGQAMTDARLLPSVKDGKVEGFKVSEVKPQGVFAAVGLRNGDVLMKINDFPVDSPEKAIQSFMALKGQNRIRLDLVRDGSPASLAYDIR